MRGSERERERERDCESVKEGGSEIELPANRNFFSHVPSFLTPTIVFSF